MKKPIIINPLEVLALRVWLEGEGKGERMKKGDRIRFTCKLGTMPTPDSTRFVGSVEPGQTGEYIGKHPNRRLKGWHLAQTDAGEFVPMSPTQFEAVKPQAQRQAVKDSLRGMEGQ